MRKLRPREVKGQNTTEASQLVVAGLTLESGGSARCLAAARPGTRPLGSLPSPPHPGRHPGNGKLAACQVPGALKSWSPAPAPPHSPSPEQSTLGRGNILAPTRPGGAATAPCPLHPPWGGHAGRLPPRPRPLPGCPPGLRASRACTSNRIGGILPSLPSPSGTRR